MTRSAKYSTVVTVPVTPAMSRAIGTKATEGEFRSKAAWIRKAIRRGLEQSWKVEE